MSARELRGELYALPYFRSAKEIREFQIKTVVQQLVQKFPIALRLLEKRYGDNERVTRELRGELYTPLFPLKEGDQGVKSKRIN